MEPELEYRKVTTAELPYVSYLCLWGVSKQQKEAMKGPMAQRLAWIKEMWPQGLEIIVALGPRHSKRGLIEYLPIEVAPAPVTGAHSLFLDCLWVLPRFNNTGVGTGLMHHFLDEAREAGGASVLSYERAKWFGYFDYMPASFFKRFGFREVARDDARVLLHLDLEGHTSPTLLTAKRRRIKTEGKTTVEVFCNRQCPWCGWTTDEIRRNARDVAVRFQRINTDTRATIEKYGLARGVSINGHPVIKRMAAWKEVKSALDSQLASDNR